MSSAIVKSPICDFFYDAFILCSSYSIFLRRFFFIMIFCSCSKKKVNKKLSLQTHYKASVLYLCWSFCHPDMYITIAPSALSVEEVRYVDPPSSCFIHAGHKDEQIRYENLKWSAFKYRGEKRREEKKKQKGNHFGFYKSRKNLGEKQNACQDWRRISMGVFWHGL